MFDFVSGLTKVLKLGRFINVILFCLLFRFRLLASEQGGDNSIPQLVPLSLPPAEQRRLVEDMLRVIDLDPSSYRLGLSQVRLLF